MRTLKLILLFILLTDNYSYIRAQSNYYKNLKKKSTVKNSVLSTGTWYKFSIEKSGVYKIDRSFLQNLGINTNDINPKNIKIYGNGGALLPMLNNEPRFDGLQENAIYIQGENDNSFDDNDYILFYGKGAHSWNVDTNSPNLSRHINNIYSDKAYYFLTIDDNQGKRIEQLPEITTNATIQVNSYDDYAVFEEDNVNLFSNGQQWFGKNLSFENTTNVSFDFDNIDDTKNIWVRVRGVIESFTPSSMSVKVNGNQLSTINFPAISTSNNNLTLAIPREEISSITISDNTINVEVTYNNNGNPSAKAYLDYVEVIGRKKLIAGNKQFSFRSFDIANLVSSSVAQFNVQNASSIFQIWDVTNHLNPKNIKNQSSNANFSFKTNGGILKEYIVINENDYFTPKKVDGLLQNQNLHSLQDIDYVIITRDFLANEAERLASYHRQNNNLNVRVIDIEQIYNEFASGSPDVTAIKDFVRHLYLNASSPEKRVKFVCLFGDASYDFKDRINSNNNIIPAFQSYESFDLARSYVTDDFYGMMGINEGLLTINDKQDVATGRIPVTTSTEAKEVVDKILSYYHTNAFGDWRNKITVIADDPDTPNEFVLQETVEQIADYISANRPSFNISKIYADAFVQETNSGGERYPTVEEAINNAVESGSLLINYFGHGGQDGWASERFLDINQIKKWRNPNALPLMVTVTCEFSRFDNPLRQAGGEFVFLNPNGGAASMITTTREIYISVGQRYNDVLVKKLFDIGNENLSIAQALMEMKNDPTSPRTNQRFFVYFLGDPAMKLAQPKPNIRLTKMNNIDISQSIDTIKALSKITLEGIVTDKSNNILTNFNGELSATVYDKSVNKTTLDNDNFGRKLTFDAIESSIFKGKASVKNGNFKFDFIAPKDIRIAYGKSKISLYADDNKNDRSGYTKDIIIGGINENAPEDKMGPSIKLFMNDESFVDGGNTNQSPFLIAVLEDASGINTSITAVDHDIVAILDGDQANPYVLNDFYETDLDDFTKGKVKFPFRDLETGAHTLTFKCWDAYNNSSEATLNFIVVNDRDLVLKNVLNYPNPMINYTQFWFSHNKPNEPLDVLIQIFTVSGKLIKTINQTIQTEGNLARSISWDGLDDFGNRVGKGVYVYKLNVTSTLTNAKANKYEKLVILQ